MSGVVIVGAGHAGLATAVELKEQGYEGEVTLIDRSSYEPYERPPLSKAWIGATDEPEAVVLRSDSSLREAGISLVRNTTVTGLDRNLQLLRTSNGDFAYDHLVLACGATPKAIGVPGENLAGVHRLHTLEDAVALRDSVTNANSLVVIGAGFISLEIASTLAESVPVHVVARGPRIMSRSVSEITAAHMHRRHEQAGTRFTFGAEVTRLICEDGAVSGVELSTGETLAADAVVFGIGVEPCGDWVQDAGLTYDDGIVVDASLRTSDRRIFAIGDCAKFETPSGGHRRLESVGNAADHARRVAAALAGVPEPAPESPWFWTKQVGVRVQMVGDIAEADEWLVVGDTDTEKFSVLGLRQGRIVYGESLNRPGDHVALRQALTKGAGVLNEQQRDRIQTELRAVLKELQECTLAVPV